CFPAYHGRECPCHHSPREEITFFSNCKISVFKKIMGKSKTQSIEVIRFKSMRNSLSGAKAPAARAPENAFLQTKNIHFSPHWG
ncbi:MAG: hypothetical protein WCB35_02490, partial [Methanoregula sp.]|uniref:hypothetical protein n=1 Tax=Methanoregula sp. TaxID=2052170 RepID=UPI003C78CFA8